MSIQVSALRKSALLAAVVGALLLAGCGEKSTQALAEDGKAALAKKDYRAAVLQLKTALDKEPQSVELRLLLGESLLGSGDAPGAIVELNKALEQKADPERVTPLLARALLRTGEFKRVTQTYASTTLQDKDAQASLMATVAGGWAGQGERDKANAALKAALAASPEYPPVVLLNARQLAGTRKVDEALSAVNKLLERDPGLVDAWVLKGDLLASGKRDAAGGQAAYRKALEVDKTTVGAHFALINMLLRTGDVAGAKLQVEAFKEAAPKSPLVAFVEAQLAYAGGEYAKAREISQQLMRQAPNNVGVLQLAATIALQGRELIQAETLFSKALQIAPDSSTARVGLARVYLQLGQPAKALSTVKPVVAENPDDAEALALAGDIQLTLGDAAAAESMYSRASKIAPEDTRLKTALAMTHMVRGDADTAFAELSAVAAASDNTVAEQASFAARLRRREYDLALAVVDQMARKKPEIAMQSELRGRVYLAKRDYVQARKAFEEQLKADPKVFAATSNLAALDLLERKPADARKRMVAAMQDDPKNVYAILAVAQLDTAADAPLDDIRKLLTQAIQVAPQMPEPRLQLIALTLRKRLYKDALVAAQEAAAALPNDKAVMDAVGRAQMEAGDVEQAISTFRKMAGASNNSGLAYTRLADIYRVSGKRELAESSLRKALEVEPDLVAAQVALVDLLFTANRKNEAQDLIRRLQRESPNAALGYSLEAAFHLRNKSTDAAVAAYRTGLAKTRSPAMASALHRVLMRSNQVAEADRFAASWLKDNPKDANFSYQVAEAALVRKKYPEAESRLKDLLAQNPDNVLVLNNLAHVLIAQGKDGALPLAQKASDLAPDNGAILDTLASAQAADKQMDKALATQKRAVELAPDSGELRLNLAELAIKAGDKSLARTELTRLKELGAKFNRQEEVTRLLGTL